MSGLTALPADLFGAVPTPTESPLEVIAAQINQAHADPPVADPAVVPPVCALRGMRP